MAKIVFRAWDPDQSELFPPGYRDLVPENHLVHFVRKVVAEDLDLSAIEKEAKEKADRIAADRAAKEAETGEKSRGREPKALDGVPDDKAQTNFTDPESRIMKTKDGYEQAYNAQAAVDAADQVITAADVCPHTSRSDPARES